MFHQHDFFADSVGDLNETTWWGRMRCHTVTAECLCRLPLLVISFPIFPSYIWSIAPQWRLFWTWQGEFLIRRKRGRNLVLGPGPKGVEDKECEYTYTQSMTYEIRLLLSFIKLLLIMTSYVTLLTSLSRKACLLGWLLMCAGQLASCGRAILSALLRGSNRIHIASCCLWCLCTCQMGGGCCFSRDPSTEYQTK